MKKGIAISLLAVLLLGLVGCRRQELTAEDKQRIMKQCDTIVRQYAKSKGYKITDYDLDNTDEEGKDEPYAEYALQINEDWFMEVEIDCFFQAAVSISLENTAYYANISFWDDELEFYEEDDDWEEKIKSHLKELFTINDVSQVRDEDVESVLVLYNMLAKKKHSSEKIINYVHRFDGEKEECDSVSFFMSDWCYGFERYYDEELPQVCVTLSDNIDYSQWEGFDE